MFYWLTVFVNSGEFSDLFAVLILKLVMLLKFMCQDTSLS